MLIIALVLALIGLVALVFAVVTSNELVAWVCIGASVLGVLLLIVDAVRERQQRDEDGGEGGVVEEGHEDDYVDYPEEISYEDTHDANGSSATSGTDATDESAGARRPSRRW